MADVRITEYTDPGCPWAYSAEPIRRRLDWLYSDQVEWQVRMVVLANSPEDYADKGFTPAKQASAFKQIARQHGMPIDTSERPRMAATQPACRAVVATRLHAPESTRVLLRCLRVHNFAGDALLDEPEMLERAAASAGIDDDELRHWMTDPEVDVALEQDMQAAREPIRAARLLDHKLANWSGGMRYTCPSYEITRLADGVTIAVPGFQPFAVYDVVLANLVPGTDRRPSPEGVEEVLQWAAAPLATREVAVLTDLEQGDAREQLGRIATERHVGSDGFWTLGNPV
ncbi:MAG: DsbA family protein [Actinomycetota bacterium]|nr:DsbA family protein [Actinomycetota bacterium]